MASEHEKCFISTANYRSKGKTVVVQWLELCISMAGGPSSAPGLGTKIHKLQNMATKKEERMKGTLKYWFCEMSKV